MEFSWERSWQTEGNLQICLDFRGALRRRLPCDVKFKNQFHCSKPQDGKSLLRMLVRRCVHLHHVLASKVFLEMTFGGSMNSKNHPPISRLYDRLEMCLWLGQFVQRANMEQTQHRLFTNGLTRPDSL